MNATNQPFPSLAQARWHETLRDRSHVLIRPIEHTDRDAERVFLEELPLDAGRFRLVGQSGRPGEQVVEALTDVDFVHEVAFVAVIKEDAHERIVGVSRYRTDRDLRTCECAVTVSLGWQDKGLGTRLMQHLIDMARSAGIARMFAFAPVEDLQTRDLALFLGFRRMIDEERPERAVYELELPVPA